MKIEVTQEHIEKGVPEEECNCPIALAIRDAFNVEELEVSVNATVIRVGFDHCPTPEEAEAFVCDFDDGRSVRPFTFDLPIEEETTNE
jgi:hypothetical protein